MVKIMVMITTTSIMVITPIMEDEVTRGVEAEAAAAVKDMMAMEMATAMEITMVVVVNAVVAVEESPQPSWIFEPDICKRLRQSGQDLRKRPYYN
jgi:hypothetical protein